jgi:pimeloyl-ACP methyl ester carboxylesterase
MATFVLVHGAWHGGWSWQRVTPHLRAAGHEVFTPTLTGLGERVHLATPSVNLATHVSDVVNVCRFEDLSNIVLVGHSYAGLVISGVADQIADRIAHMVYLDAFVPESGESLFSLVGPEGATAMRGLAEQHGDGWLVPPVLQILNVSDPEDVAWLEAKLTPQPIATLEEGAACTSPLAERPFARTYVLATDPSNPACLAACARVEGQPGWQVHRVATGHDLLVTRPQEVADLLLSLAR